MEIALNITLSIPDDIVSYAEEISSESDELIGELLSFRSILKDSYMKAIHQAFLHDLAKRNLSDIEDEIWLEYDKRRYPEWI